MYHTANPLPQTRLSNTLATILLSLPAPLFLPFLHAFYSTLLTLYPQLPSLRLDKYLYLLRRYVAAAFTYLARRGWDPSDELLQGYLALMQGNIGPLSPGGPGSDQAKVPDGLRYHVLDVWPDELARITLKDDCKDEHVQGAQLMMSPVRALAQDAKGKVLRARARQCLTEWDALSQGVQAGGEEGVDRDEVGDEDEGDEVRDEDDGGWNGFED
ncbi:hypothetical protein MMC22_006043 [Lobaria immixta]|nr:hypothetical protein [Lobaria immixta]